MTRVKANLGYSRFCLRKVKGKTSGLSACLRGWAWG